MRGKKNLIIQEYIPCGELEFTVGICLDHQGKVLSKIALKRKLHDGISIAAISDDYHEIADYCARVAQSFSLLGAYGAINFQLRLQEGKKDGQPIIFEINPRFSSSTGMRSLLGINEPEILLRSQVLHQEVPPMMPKTGLVLRQYFDYYLPLEVLKSIGSVPF
ncbi:ATP-grasp domain-containing protein [Dehalobacterium formicoaceticum]|uniref:ATP-grasp domain-containing protein n=1 Tax=Dehalobacterium formicoaceticum TaxID=51515 RepID=UPI0031F61334